MSRDLLLLWVWEWFYGVSFVSKLGYLVLDTVEPLTKGQFGTAGFVLYKEVFLPKRLTFLYQKIIKIMMIMIIIETKV